jgi:uncharacterized FlaG/YvyC family protein
MDITSIKPSASPHTDVPTIPAPEAAERRELIAATKSINASGLLGQNQVVFMVDRRTRRPIIRVEDRDTHEVVLQLPPEYVLRLAENLHANSPQASQFLTDT